MYSAVKGMPLSTLLIKKRLAPFNDDISDLNLVSPMTYQHEQETSSDKTLEEESIIGSKLHINPKVVERNLNLQNLLNYQE